MKVPSRRGSPIPASRGRKGKKKVETSCVLQSTLITPRERGRRSQGPKRIGWEKTIPHISLHPTGHHLLFNSSPGLLSPDLVCLALISGNLERGGGSWLPVAGPTRKKERGERRCLPEGKRKSFCFCRCRGRKRKRGHLGKKEEGEPACIVAARHLGYQEEEKKP